MYAGPCEFSKDTFFGFIISANILFLLLYIFYISRR